MEQWKLPSVSFPKVLLREFFSGNTTRGMRLSKLEEQFRGEVWKHPWLSMYGNECCRSTMWCVQCAVSHTSAYILNCVNNTLSGNCGFFTNLSLAKRTNSILAFTSALERCRSFRHVNISSIQHLGNQSIQRCVQSSAGMDKDPILIWASEH